jgi:hypothetical protein
MEMVFMGNAQLHRKRRYTLAELGEQEILTFQRGSLPHVALVDLFRQAGRGAQTGAHDFIDLRHGAAGAGRLWCGHAAAAARCSGCWPSLT